MVADAKLALAQLTTALKGKIAPDTFRSWRDRLRGRNSNKTQEQEATLSTSAMPIHPLRLCKEIRDFMERDAILCVDGQEILNYGRQAIPTYVARHRLNSGAFGTMGVGMPFGLGAKAACPDKQVIVLHGDGSFGMNAMEFDTAVRHGLASAHRHQSERRLDRRSAEGTSRPRPRLHRFDQMAQALGGYGEFVEKPDDVRPALERGMTAVRKGQPALINVVTDWRARATTADFTRYAT